MIIKPIFTLLFLLLLVCKSSAQLTDWEVGLFLGGTAYQGDLSDSQTSLVIGYTGRYKYYYTLNFRGNILFSRLKGADEIAGAFQRNFSFKSNIIEISGMAEWEPLGRWRELRTGKEKLKFSPYLLGGLGFVFCNPNARFGQVTNPDLQERINQDKRSGNARLLLVIPIGGGVRYDINQTLMISAETAVRYPFTDYLDGISKAANPKAGDWYWFYGITAMYRLP